MRQLKLVYDHLDRVIPLGLSLLWPSNTLALISNAVSISTGQPWLEYLHRNGGPADLDILLERALGWLKHSQDVVGSGGVGCFELYRWTRGYPEVTGYIIPTLWDCHRVMGQPDLANRAVRMADWELSVQRPSGGFEGYYEGDGKPETVFNTGQVIRGLVRAYEETGEERYLEGALRAANWIVSVQQSDGSWSDHNFKGMKRVYDTYVAGPLAYLGKLAHSPTFVKAAVANCDFALEHQEENGWFGLCDNSPGMCEAPLTHTICYTVDGLLEVGTVLENSTYVERAKKAADRLMHQAEIRGILYARFDSRWRPQASYCCVPGCGQLGVILMKLYKIYDDPRYLNCALKLVDFLAYVQSLTLNRKHQRGGLSASYPLWGMYCPFKYPSWSVKYYVDLLLMVRQVTAQQVHL